MIHLENLETYVNETKGLSLEIDLEENYYFIWTDIPRIDKGCVHLWSTVDLTQEELQRAIDMVGAYRKGRESMRNELNQKEDDNETLASKLHDELMGLKVTLKGLKYLRTHKEEHDTFYTVVLHEPVLRIIASVMDVQTHFEPFIGETWIFNSAEWKALLAVHNCLREGELRDA